MLSLLHTLSTRIQRSLTRHIVADSAALSILLRTLRDAEAGGEQRVFTDTSAIPERLRSLVARHAADEERHEGLLTDALADLGAEDSGEHADIFAVLDGEADEVFSQDLSNPDNLAAAYWMVYAMERRISSFLTELEAGMGELRPELRATIATIRADEERHIVWCQVVTWALQRGDMAAWEATRDRMVAIEASNYGQIQAANLHAMLDGGLADMPTWQRWAWRIGAKVLEVTGMTVPVTDPEGRLASKEWRPSRSAQLRIAA